MSGWVTVCCNGEPHCRHENGFAHYRGKLFLFDGRRIQAVDIFDPETSSWKSASAPPLEIHHFQPVMVENQIWLIGTMTGEFPGETPLESVMIYEPDNDQWKTGPAIPKECRRGAAGCVLHSDGWIHVVGGIIDGHHSGTQVCRCAFKSHQALYPTAVCMLISYGSPLAAVRGVVSPSWSVSNV